MSDRDSPEASAIDVMADTAEAARSRRNAGAVLVASTLAPDAPIRPRHLLSYALAIVLTLAALLFAVSGANVVGPASVWIAGFLTLSLGLIVYLGLSLWQRLSRLVRAGREARTGARLHLRFVGLFSLAAVAPAILIALFSGLTIGQGIQAWFSDQVRGAIEATREFGKQSIEKAGDAVKVDMSAMALDLNAAAAQAAADPSGWQAFLERQADRRGFVAVYILDGSGRIRTAAERATGVPPFVPPAADDFANARAGDVDVNIDSTAVARGLYRLDGFDDAFLASVRLPEPGQLAAFERADRAVNAYQVIEARQGMVQLLFTLAYVETVLLVLIGSAWLGLISARRISAPVGLLAEAAERVRAGDLSVRVETGGGSDDEISALANTFNRMTEELRSQRVALEAARAQAEIRSAFIGAVLEGVSAGVVSLDGEMRIRAANGSAARFLKSSQENIESIMFSEIAPEFMAIVARARPGSAAQGQAERPLDGEPVLFDVRAAWAGQDLVVTFDDVSGLLAAQRQAAWKDVARRIAHEIKNPLTPIQLAAERLKRRYAPAEEPDREAFARMTDTIVRQVADIGRMVDEFSSFARMPAPRFAREDMCEVARQAVFAQRIASPDIEVSVDTPEQPVWVLMDARLIAQALANLLKNAAEAIVARRARDGETFAAAIALNLVSGDGQARIEVLDDGIGFPAQGRRRLLEPYMTTRAKGTGLGLAIVSRVLEEHGGGLDLADRSDGRAGACVRVHLPLAENGAAPAAPIKESAHGG